MNYSMHYAKLMERAKSRSLDVYSEKHHILPKCLGGDNSPENMVRLTPEEHYVAHQLLVKMHPGNYKLLWSAMSMTNGTKVMARTNKLYGWLRRQFAIEQSMRGKPHTPEAKEKMSKTRTGLKRRPHSEETKRKMSEAARGKKKSPEAVAASVKTRTGMKTGPHSSEWNEKIRQSNIEASKHRDHAEKQTEEYKRKQAERMREVWAKRKAGELPNPQRKSGDKET